jgi:hypothetical protein
VPNPRRSLGLRATDLLIGLLDEIAQKLEKKIVRVKVAA